jgi:hypothetical protein
VRPAGGTANFDDDVAWHVRRPRSDPHFTPGHRDGDRNTLHQRHKTSLENFHHC